MPAVAVSRFRVFATGGNLKAKRELYRVYFKPADRTGLTLYVGRVLGEPRRLESCELFAHFMQPIAQAQNWYVSEMPYRTLYAPGFATKAAAIAFAKEQLKAEDVVRRLAPEEALF